MKDFKDFQLIRVLAWQSSVSFHLTPNHPFCESAHDFPLFLFLLFLLSLNTMRIWRFCLPWKFNWTCFLSSWWNCCLARHLRGVYEILELNFYFMVLLLHLILWAYLFMIFGLPGKGKERCRSLEDETEYLKFMFSLLFTFHIVSYFIFFLLIVDPYFCSHRTQKCSLQAIQAINLNNVSF